MPTVEIIAVGTELLLGQILNTHGQFLGRELAALGMDVFYQTSVGDNRPRVIQAIARAWERSDIVILTGGLGPTDDDLTKESLAGFLGLELVQDEGSRRSLEEFFARRARRMTPNNLKQALVPKGGKALPNPNGTAPGILLETGGKAAILLPGPPSELIPMFQDQVRPYLIERWGAGGQVILSRVLRLAGIGESDAETRVKDILDRQRNPTIAPLASGGEVTFRLTAKAADQVTAASLLDASEAEMRGRVGEYIYGADRQSINEVVGDILTRSGLTLAVAESCTGGLIGHQLTQRPGSSDYFMLGVTAYSNPSKVKALGVPEATIRCFGAVSEETALAMAEGVRRAGGTDLGLSTTGIAGPGGGTAEKPVGLVYGALVWPGGREVRRWEFIGTRPIVKDRAAFASLTMLWSRLGALGRAAAEPGATAPKGRPD
ncbi:MAG TPA: competence/damage-inducible protein A [Bacillota bacterium]